jgi:quinoprotein glucose dehydrogenase
VDELGRGLGEAASPSLVTAWIHLAATAGDTRQVLLLEQHLADAALGGETRAAALEALRELDPAGRPARLRAALEDEEEVLRERAFQSLDDLPRAEALEHLDRALESGSVAIRKAAVDALAKLPGEEADQRLTSKLLQLARGEESPGLALELLEASAERPDPGLRGARDEALETLSAYAGAETLSPEEAALLTGGRAERGREVFREHSELSCLRCHRVGEEGGEATGGEVGPDLSDVGRRLGRGALLESILRPDAVLADGFERWILLTVEDRPLGGRILAEDEESILLETPGGTTLELATDQVAQRRRDASAMPSDLAEKISRRDLRNLVEYLVSLDAP